MAGCHACGEKLEFERVYRTTECPGCGREVKACKNCRFYSPGVHWDCKETIPEAVREKDRVNFCDYFELPKGESAPDAGKPSAPTDSFNKLFDS